MDELIRVTRGVWRRPEHLQDFAARVAAVLTACPVGTVACGLTAARLHRLWLPSIPDERIELILHPETPRPSRRPGSERLGVRGRRQILQADETTLLNGTLVTTEARTWVDLAARLPLADLVAAGDSALRGTATLDELARLIARARHRPGVVRARVALPLLDGRSRSRPESHLRHAIVSAGLPKPAVNEPIYDSHGQWVAEPDLSYDDARLALEYNGAEHADARRMRRDITRQFDVVRRGGWQTVVFGPSEVFGRPDQVVSLVRQLRHERLRAAS